MSKGFIRPVNWRLTRSVMAEDFVYYGGSRMIELLAGHYQHELDYRMAAKWRQARTDPSLPMQFIKRA